MEQFKLASWNIAWADKLLDQLQDPAPAKKAAAERRLQAIRAEIAGIDADILVIIEGPKGAVRAGRFFELVAPAYDLVARDSGGDRAYLTQGRQWIWFLLRKGSGIEGTLMNLDRWVDLTAQASFDEHAAAWKLGLPMFVRETGDLIFQSEVSHRHYRHPQVLLARIGDFHFDVIGAHLKSRHINLRTPAGVGQPGFFRNNPEFVAEVVEARAKLTSEATNVRYYIDARFKEDVGVPIILAGDLNDGPGKERVEEQFLLHDLITNLQGEVFFAQRFLNHALFDFAEEERWTVQFEDVLDPRRPREILLDHIMFTQSLTGSPQRGAAPFRARRNGGKVEHEAHHLANAQAPRVSHTSDHRAVSMVFEKRPPPDVG